MFPQTASPGGCKVILIANIWLFFTVYFTVYFQMFFQCAFLKVWKVTLITMVWLHSTVSHEMELKISPPELLKKIHIYCIWRAYPNCAFSSVSSNYLPARMQSQTALWVFISLFRKWNIFFFKLILRLQFSSKIVETFFTW